MKVFLSYAPEDRDVAQPLAADLRSGGYDVYPDAHWPERVEAAMRQAEAFIVLLSPAAVASPFVEQEIKLALVSEHLANRVIPVVVGASSIPWILEEMEPIRVSRRSRTLGTTVLERLQRSEGVPAR